MSLKQFLLTNFFFFSPFGLGMLFVPQLIFPLLDVDLNPDGIIMARTVGSMLFSFGLSCWVAKDASIHDLGLRAVLMANFSFHLIDSGLTFIGAFSEHMNGLGFMFSSTHLIFALGFLFFLRRGTN